MSGQTCRNHNARPQLSAYPTVYFIDKTTGETVHMSIKDVTDIYDQDRKEAAKERARAKRVEQKSGRWS